MVVDPEILIIFRYFLNQTDIFLIFIKFSFQWHLITGSGTPGVIGMACAHVKRPGSVHQGIGHQPLTKTLNIGKYAGIFQFIKKFEEISKLTNIPLISDLSRNNLL